MYLVLQFDSILNLSIATQPVSLETVAVIHSENADLFLEAGATILHDNGGMGYEKKSDALAAMLAYELEMEERFGVIKAEIKKQFPPDNEEALRAIQSLEAQGYRQ